MPVLHQHDNDSDAVKIIHEKEKTKRYFLYLGSLVTLALVGIYFAAKNGGVVSGSLKEGSISVNLQKPIVAQAGVPTSSYQAPQGNIQFTTGSVNAGVIQKLADQNVSISPTQFTGQNYINREFGYLFSVSHPENWSIQYDPNGNGQRVNTFTASGGSQFIIGVEQLPMEMSIVNYVPIALQNLMQTGIIQAMPLVEYDNPSNTAFLYYHSLNDGAEAYQKIIIRGTKAYGASAKYFEGRDNDIIASDLIQMISSFTLIGN